MPFVAKTPARLAKRGTKLEVLAPLLLVWSQAVAVDLPLNSPQFDGGVVSACIRDMDGKVLYERNSSARLIPASNQKLLTCAFALNTLGIDYRPITRIWKTPMRTVVESEGDPLMTKGRLDEAARKLHLDTTLPVFVKEAYAPYWPDSWEIDDLPNKYAAPICAFTVDRGSFELWTDEGKLKLLPDSYGTRIKWLPSQQALTFNYDPFRREVTVVGQLPADKRRLDTLSLPRPDEAAASLIGRSFSKTTTVPTLAPSAILEGNTIKEIVNACLPPSDNNIAEHLLLMTAGHLEPLEERPYPQARRQLATFLNRVVGISPNDINVFDGSGMSRHNMITTRALTQLLVWSNKQPTGSLWRASLAKPGAGTLNGRLSGVDFAGKTGTLDMVVGLSGYVHAKSGKDYAVSVLLNNFCGTSKDARDAADQFIKNVADQM